MDYNNFEEELPTEMLAKGKSYFGAGSVSELVKEDGHWLASVEGTEHQKYPDEMLAFYKPIIIKSASEAHSRSYYRQVARDLKDLLKTKGGRAVVIELLETLRVKHANKPAMIDELRRVL